MRARLVLYWNNNKKILIVLILCSSITVLAEDTIKMVKFEIVTLRVENKQLRNRL